LIQANIAIVSTAIESLTTLRQAGVDQKHAEAIIDVIERLHSDYVTKSDLNAAVANLNAAISRVESKFESRFGQLEAKMESKIGEAKNAIWLPFFFLFATLIASHFWK
jgi:signal transduction protein with GAF and PtsI domain